MTRPIEEEVVETVIIEDECEELAVSLYPAGGFASLSLTYEAARYIARQIKGTDKQPVIFYIGDYDPADVLIDRDIEAKLHQHLPAHVEVDFRRIAINEEQIIALDLPTKPRKSGDKRAPRVKGTVEAEAMPARLLRRLLRDEVEGCLPDSALAVAKAAEESERTMLLSLAQQMPRAAS